MTFLMLRLLLLLSLLTAAANTQAQIPLASLGQLPATESPEISPDGKYVAAIVNSGNLPEVSIGEFPGTNLRAVLKLKYADDRIEWIQWASDERLLVSASYSELVLGERVRVNKLYSIDVLGEDLVPLIPNVGITWDVRGNSNRSGSRRPRDGDRVLSMLPDEPDRILIQLFNFDFREWFIYKLNIYNNKFEQQLVKQVDAFYWLADTFGRVALGVDWEPNEKLVQFWYRGIDQSDWQLMREIPAEDEESFNTLAVHNGKLLVLSNHAVGREALWQYDADSRSFEKVLFAADDADISGVIWGPGQTRVIGAVHYADRRIETYFDAADIDAQLIAAKSLPGFELSIVSRSLDRSRLMIKASRDDFPPKYIWLDTATQQGGAWFSQYPELEKWELAKKTRVSFVARDGLDVSGYLTMPIMNAAERPPLVVYAHDGPEARSTPGFDAYTQFLASRGYAVLEVNHRGSRGFGYDFMAAGYREWGGKMQQDIYDGIAWLESQEMVNTKKTCFFGSGFGGYVALMAAAQKPGEFNCFVSIGGISDIVDYLRMDGRYAFAHERNKIRIGDMYDGDDKDRLKTISPIDLAHRISDPVLLIHGDRDASVPFKQSKALSRKIDRNHKGNQFITVENGTHSLDNNENRLLVFRSLERFLEKYLD